MTGLDETVSGNPSMFSWNESTQSWNAISNTKNTILQPGDFYRVFVRGDRTSDLSSTSYSGTSTTLRSTGTLYTGNYILTPSVSSGEFFALANPYQSKIDMADVAPVNVAQDMYYWDPALGTNGNYTSIDIATGIGTAGAATQVLQPGQAVFFQSTGSSSISITEGNKVAGTTPLGVFNYPTNEQKLRIKLYQTSRFNGGKSESDGLYIDFQDTYSNAVDFNDAIKLDGLNTNISILKPSGNKLMVERRTLPMNDESIVLNIDNHISTDYTMTIDTNNFIGMHVSILDHFNNSVTPLIQDNINLFHFTVDLNDVNSVEPNRFELVFQNTTLSSNIDELSRSKIYPNPVLGDELNIELNQADKGGLLSIQIYNAMGQLIRSERSLILNSNIVTIDQMKTLNSGVYLIQLTLNRSTTTHRFVKE